ncbi:MAG: hypothetical protein WC781_03605 [Candidatus Pacearchaeota archaeon]|jgi:hypothetical protein
MKLKTILIIAIVFVAFLILIVLLSSSNNPKIPSNLTQPTNPGEPPLIIPNQTKPDQSQSNQNISSNQSLPQNNYTSNYSTPSNNYSNLPEEYDNWSSIRANDIANVPSGWSQPIRVSINTDNWEDGAYITGDGNTLYWAYYPGDLLNDAMAGSFKGNVNEYQSNKPFTTKTLSSISDPPWSVGGVMISGSDMYYMSNKDTGNGKHTTQIYKNNERMSFNNPDENQDDPHYCALKDELYFWKDDTGDKNIYVYSNNEVKKLPSPINSGQSDMQPFLTNDCQTMYFTSDRSGSNIIYKSSRSGEDWSSPQIVISSNVAVGEPTFTSDGKTMFFVQIFHSPEGKYNSDIMYTEKLS